jgi:hypothetical protein
MYCQVCEEEVQAMVEQRKVRRAGQTMTVKTPLSCERVKVCPRTAFCRFVNPLSTRNPLTEKNIAPTAS